MKLTTKNILRIIVVSIIGIFLIYCSVIFIIRPEQITYSDCGRLISKSNDEVAIKHGVQTELYLNIQFEKTGFKSINVNPTDYFQFKNGQTVCFTLNQKQSVFDRLSWIIGALNLAVGVLILLGVFVNYLTTK